MPANTTGSLTATGSVTHYKTNRALFAQFGISGTYGTVQFVFEVSADGTNWAPTSAVLQSTAALVTGTVSPADNATLSWRVRCADVQYVRLRVTAIASGSVAVTATSDDLTLNGTDPVFVLAAADGAITAKTGVVLITKGSAAALTLAAPTAVTDDGKELEIVSTTAFAHTVTNAAPGFNNAGAAGDVATYGAAAGNSMNVVAYNGIWFAKNLQGVTLA